MADLYYLRYNTGGSTDTVNFTNDPNKEGYTLWIPGSYICTNASATTELYNGKFILPQSAKGLFAKCVSSYIEGADTDEWDTSECTDMSYMFYDCKLLKHISHDNWDTSNVTDMSYMFYNCDLGDWNYGKVKLTFDTSNVTDMSYMFYGCYYMRTLDMSTWTTPKLENTEGMFMGAGLRDTIDLSTWNTPNLKNTNQMFNNTITNLGLSTIILGENWDVSNLVDCSKMFYGQHYLQHIYIKENTDWATEAVLCTSSSNMFANCISLENYNYENRWDLTRANNTKPNWLFDIYHPWKKYQVYIRRV